MFRVETKFQIEQELTRGEVARQEGFEGRARVCARRAVGVAAREYYVLRGQDMSGASAYDIIRMLEEEPAFSGEIREAAQRLSGRVSEDFLLPPGVDLMADARWLVNELERLSIQ